MMTSRREFVVCCASSMAYLVGNRPTRYAAPLRLGLLTSPAIASSVVEDVKAGVNLGISEAARLAGILGGTVELVTIDAAAEWL
jgi:hypothetical protein